MKDVRKQKDEYRSLGAVREEERDDSSSTDVDLEALDLNEKDYLNGTPRAEKKEDGGLRGVLKEYWWIVDTFLLFTIIVLLLGSSWTGHGRYHLFEGGGDLTGFAPEFSQKITTFSPDPAFVPENTSEFFSKETKQKWLDLVPSKCLIDLYLVD